ncbi:hypothetical protein PybrP1_009631 [[Pythium] brassicae (nom. inval.)]|nr:hypothetical protein PybrP1_009631 [[Pythium] brassicae (nom. inval.)]
MLSSHARLQARQGQHAPPRHEYLQQLVDEFQRSVHPLRREEIVANLANFAYDPINYAALAHLQVMDLFLDLLDSDLHPTHDDSQASAGHTASKRPFSSASSCLLAEFALGGICNCIADLALQASFVAGDGLSLVTPYIWSIGDDPHEPLTSRQYAGRLRAVLAALTIAFFLLDSRAFADVTSERLRGHIESLEFHANTQIANIAAAYRARYEELLACAVIP